MKRFLILLIISIIQILNVLAQVPSEIQDPYTIGINKLPARTYLWPAENVEEAKKSTYEMNSWVKSLNGQWQFQWSPDPQSRSVDFYKADYESKNWKNIPVPSTIERQGYGVPLYVNVAYPFKVNPPRVMDEPDSAYTNFKSRNPVGSYLKYFFIPKNWNNKQVIIHFAGISSAAFVWVNGQKVGYTQGSRLPAEFDITSYIKKGENRLAVEVYKYCDGSYLEDQDFWRLSGIFRDVFIRAIPKISLWDVYAQPSVNLQTKQGKISVHYTSANFTDAVGKDYRISVSVLSPLNKPVANKSFKIKDIKHGFNDELILPEIAIENSQLWWNEKPLQYTVQVVLKNKNKVVEAYQLPVGFRKIEVDGEKILFNGMLLKIRGVNRHEFSPEQGYVVPKEQMIAELKLMKKANINFVRTSHYPNDPRWYELCNKYGMMIMDEANVESHGLSYHKKVLPGDKPEWMYGTVDRMKRMVIRDRQNPCVVMWSLGNEAGYGKAFMEMRKTALNHDPEKRLIHYADMNLAADFDSQTYPTIEWLYQHLHHNAIRSGEHGELAINEQHGKYPSGKPFVMNEYAHAMGNSLGDFKDYWDFIYAHDLFAGGFVWDWIDQALYKDPKNPNSGFVYGGDFGDFPNNNNFCINGLIGADLKPHPHYQELKKIYQPIYFKLVNQKPFAVKIVNHNLAINANQYVFSYQIIENGIVTQNKVLSAMNCNPADSTVINLKDLKFNNEKETFIAFSASLKDSCLWADKSYVVAWEQFKLSDAEPKKVELSSTNKLNVKEDKNTYSILGNNFKAIIDKSSGLISDLKEKDMEVITEGMRFNFWRALTDNDKGWKVDQKLGVWKNEASNYDLKSIKIDSTEIGVISIESSYLFKGTQTLGKLKYLFYADGRIGFNVELKVPENAPNIPRIGLQFSLNKKLIKIEWYGRGPQENYWDRKTGAAIGIYKSSVNNWISPYVRPQENANRCEVRWISFADEESKIEFISDINEGLSVSAWPYEQATLNNAQHNFELVTGKNLVVNIDYKQMGVGGDNSWGLPVLDQYQIHPGNYSYNFTLKSLNR